MNLNDPSVTQETFTPFKMGLFLSVPISATTGSPSLSYLQPFISGHIFSSAGVLIGAELFLIIAQFLFKLESIPILDLPNQQIIQMPVQDFQEFLKTFTRNTTGSSFSTQPSTSSAGSRGFISPLPPEAPFVISLYVTSDFSNNFYSPSVWIIIPIIALPGLRGALPLLILSLLATIFVRTVVSPQATGAKPVQKQEELPNSFLNISPEELLRFLSRFGKFFSSH
ncbi:hypothetical protein [Desulfitobacterium sp.]|uniref:hypothetical protein n=1 Tax=Desulfitobacterium sp. TaxID=49981 RepID=UPI002BC79470|nr:hypothetical protein [Desulfitobacterium sp.]HVJ48609.1 hypothetical protein [Desulfitobacterium sp.]